ncbi:MAG: hypothetical protein ACI9RM_001081 [Ulvibacter sp.]|jgi:hypothetical protein
MKISKNKTCQVDRFVFKIAIVETYVRGGCAGKKKGIVSPLF